MGRLLILRTLLVAMLAGSIGLAQRITGSITGTVVDPTNAAVAGATVRLTNKGT